MIFVRYARILVLVALGTALLVAIAVGVAVLGSSDATAAPPANCGPGSHWVDSCGGGIPPYPDVFANNSGILTGIDLDLNFDPNCDSDLNVPMNGPVTVDRQDASDDSANFPGPPNPPVADAHIDAIDTEIVSMVLTGGGFTLRAGAGGAPALLPSKGLVVEQAADNTKADSFFDVFFELAFSPSGPNVYNQQPLRVTAVIGQVPPVGAAYMQPNTCLPLFTSPVGGINVANLASLCPATPWVVPPGDTDCDGFTDADEGMIGTDAADPCPDNTSDDAWPPDFDNNKVINISDVFFLLPPTFGTAVPSPTSPRRDIVPDGVINISDVFKVLPPIFGASCT